MNKNNHANTAILIGGGMAGKLIAAAISPYFSKVQIFEKDNKPLQEKEIRPGVSQANQIHVLLQAGDHALETLFPGFKRDMVSRGSIQIDSVKDMAWFHYGSWKQRYRSELTTLLQTRRLLESYVEEKINQFENVTYTYGVKVENYLIENGRVCGVITKQETFRADLVIDTSGASAMSKSSIGQAVPEEKVEIGLCYATRQFELTERERDFKLKLIYPEAPQQKLGGTMSMIENQKYTVTLIGYLNSIDPAAIRTEEGFSQYAKKLPLQDFAQELEGGKSLTETKIYQIPHIVWRRFDQIQLPEGLLVAGDSFCRVDPVFGQGMSVAALEALAIKEFFEVTPKHMNLNKLQKKLAKIVAPVWSMVLCEDFRYEAVKGKRPFGLKFQQWYVKEIFLLSAKNRKIYDEFIKVMNLVSPPTILFKPYILKEVLKRKG
ncbi:FAD-dependent monooxygenase [Bacillus sp. UNC438CL73TsuS30]|uniref:FAD-dependent monooxygenase n=1 Tax=Bacillus sp. UNC438CL73TsuS30 TaxID=1340434 RepID=UPI0004793271|nr:FAD-dependent monooxygenase [Bacillus sp. UNC438CL73TsuS30]